MKPDQIRAVASQAEPHIRRICEHLFPHGKVYGSEFVVGNIQGDPGDSLSINLNHGKWSDFAGTEPGGSDIVSLYAAAKQLSQSDAAEEVARLINVTIPTNPQPSKKKTPLSFIHYRSHRMPRHRI